MKKLLSILGSIAMIGTTSATVVACGKTGEKQVESEDFRTRLAEKLDAIKELKSKTETEQQKNWAPVASKITEALNSVINTAESALNTEDLTEELAEEQISKLDEGFETFKLGIPQNIISEVIDKQSQSDIKDLFSKSWTHAEFFGSGDYLTQKVVDRFEQSVQKAAQQVGYEGNELTNLVAAVHQWALDNLTLVYINVDENGEQQIKDEYKKSDSDAIKIEELFLKSVQNDFPEADLTNPEFWAQNPKLSLGIKFPKDKLNQDIKDFWTFTFAENTPFEKSQEKLQGIIDKVERNGNGQVVFRIPKLKSKDSLTNFMDRELKKIFYGKFFIPSNIFTGWGALPNPEQVEKAIDWDSPKDREIGIKKRDVNGDLFKIKLSYRIEWIK